MNQEQFMQLQMIEQEVNQLNQQTELVEQNLNEISELKAGLEEIEKNETKEILVNVGKRIYIPVEIKEKSLVVEVGNKNFVKKSISETKKLIDEQLKKLNEAKLQIVERLQELEMTMRDLVREASNSDKGHHGCGSDECGCEEDCGDECSCGHDHK
ncbi:Prefoldin subunit alpha [uncultured archaeon]|nr:Prefoldin subunit alpha [uncultured archaeon]